MLSIYATDVDGNIIKMPQPSYMVINQDENVPADDLTVTFPLTDIFSEMVNISVKENNQLVFYGVVDEQQIISDDTCGYIKIIGRSMAALLLDNESKPINYTNLSVSVLFSRHLSPLGFNKYKGDDATYYGTFNVAKGTTEWQVLYGFGINAFGRIPRIEADGTVNFNGSENQEVIHFSNIDGMGYNSIKENTKRCKVISKVMVKSKENSSYISGIVNEDALKRKINRVRYLDAATTASSIDTANKMIKNSVDDSYEITLICPLRLLDIMGSKASIYDTSIGLRENLYVSSVHYKLSSNGEYTTVILKKER